MRMECECLERVCGGPFYSSKGRFPPSSNMGTCQTDIRRIRSAFPPNFTGKHLHVGSADSLWPPLATAFIWVSAWWVLMSNGRCQGLVGWFGLVCGPPFACVTQHWIFCSIVLRLLSVFALFWVCVPAIQESPKLVEIVRNKPYNCFWCLKAMKRCRS